MNDTPVERRVEADGVSVRYREHGRGETVIVLHRDGDRAANEFEQMLAEKFRVVALESGAFAARSPQEAGRLLARAVEALATGKYALVAYRHAAAAALCHAAEPLPALESLVLLSPSGDFAPAEPRLSLIKVPTLLLVGTKDEPATVTVGRVCAESIPECYPMLVYDSGPSMASERPAALYEAVSDFLQRRGRFVLERQHSAISP